MKIHSTQLVPELTPFFNRAANLAETPVKAEVDELCRRLSGFSTYKYMDIADQVVDLKMPRGYLHVRIIDEADGMEIASSFSTTDEPSTPEFITMLVTLNQRSLTGQWVETRALPERDRGVLDLMVRFEPRPVPLSFNDLS